MKEKNISFLGIVECEQKKNQIWPELIENLCFFGGGEGDNFFNCLRNAVRS